MKEHTAYCAPGHYVVFIMLSFKCSTTSDTRGRRNVVWIERRLYHCATLSLSDQQVQSAEPSKHLLLPSGLAQALLVSPPQPPPVLRPEQAPRPVYFSRRFRPPSSQRQNLCHGGIRWSHTPDFRVPASWKRAEGSQFVLGQKVNTNMALCTSYSVNTQ